MKWVVKYCLQAAASKIPTTDRRFDDVNKAHARLMDWHKSWGSTTYNYWVEEEAEDVF